jgi:hypothetical protein
MVDTNQLASAVGVGIIESGDMKRSLLDWHEMYYNQSSWLKKRVESLELPSSIASEFSRLTLAEFNATLSDSTLDSQFQMLIRKLNTSVEMACAFGGVLFKPYNCGGNVLTDVVTQLDFVPVAYSQCGLTSVICPEYIAKGKDVYTRLEYHTYDTLAHTHTVKNLCYHSNSLNGLGQPCNLAEVPEWADMVAEKVYPNVDRPLFSYFRMPFAISTHTSACITPRTHRRTVATVY